MDVLNKYNRDLYLFIEYQQVIKESKLTGVNSAKQQIYQIYRGLLRTNEAENLIDKHFEYHNSNAIKKLFTFKDERAWLKDNLKPLIQQTADFKNQVETKMAGEYFQELKTQISDHASGMTRKSLHTRLLDPKTIEHALGHLAHVSGIKQDRILGLTAQNEKLQQQLKNVVMNLSEEGRDRKQIQNLLDFAPDLKKSIERKKDISNQMTR